MPIVRFTSTSMILLGVYGAGIRILRQFSKWVAERVISEYLHRAFPGAAVTAIDVTSRIGRLYRGPSDGVRFICCDVEGIAAARPDHSTSWCCATCFIMCHAHPDRRCSMLFGEAWLLGVHSSARIGSGATLQSTGSAMPRTDGSPATR